MSAAPARRAAIVARLCSLAALLLAGCSALVTPSGDPVACVLGATGSDPCPMGFTCVDGFCAQRVVPGDGGCIAETEERCDGDDNDCDGMIDEGHDGDGDGFSWCGGGVMTQADCDDTDARIHPTAPDGTPIEVCDERDNDCDGMVDEEAATPETCNGRDDDCDGMVDEPPDAGTLCPAGQECIEQTCIVPNCTHPGHACPAGQRCDIEAAVPSCVEGRCPTVACPMGTVCDTASGSCVTLRPLGSGCTTDAQCASGRCMLSGGFRLAGLPARVCGLACCSDRDCPPGNICWASGSGARSCLPPDVVGLTPGAGMPAASCTQGTECASGLCNAGGIGCVGPCRASADCATSGTCGTLGPWDRPGQPSTVELACMPRPGSGEFGAPCSSPAECAEGVCLVGGGSGTCGRACATSADCPISHYCGAIYREVSGRIDTFHVCQERFGLDVLGTGDSCCSFVCSPDVCRDHLCVGSQCTSPCCKDTHCSGGRTCRPVTGESVWDMACI